MLLPLRLPKRIPRRTTAIWNCTSKRSIRDLTHQRYSVLMYGDIGFGVCVDCLDDFCKRYLLCEDEDDRLPYRKLFIPAYLPENVVDAVQKYMSIVYSIYEKLPVLDDLE